MGHILFRYVVCLLIFVEVNGNVKPRSCQIGSRVHILHALCVYGYSAYVVFTVFNNISAAEQTIYIAALRVYRNVLKRPVPRCLPRRK